MKKFDAREILERPQRVMKYVGIWPKINPSRLDAIRGLFPFILLTISTLLLFTKGLFDFMEGIYETGGYGMCVTLVTFHAAFKVWFLLTNKAPFFEILANLEDQSLLYHNDSSNIYLHTQLQFGKKTFKALMIMCGNAALTAGISEYVYGYKGNPRLLPIKTDPSHLTMYLTLWILYFIMLAYCGSVIGSFEGLVAILITAGVAQLKVLHQEILNAIDLYPSDIDLTKEEIQYYDQTVNKLLIRCVKRHNAIERYIVSIEDKFSLAFLVQYFITLGVTAMLGFNFIFTPVTSPDFVSCIFFFIADLIQVFVVCNNCNEIILESQNIRDACYFSNWKVCGPTVRKTLYIIMERTKRPFYLTMRKFSIISLNTFLIILKTSMSYFTVLESLYGNH